MKLTHRTLSLALLATLGAGLGGVGVFNFFVDPYWVWREREGVVATPVLKNKLRHAKPLQVVTRRPRTVVFGNSRVLRGMDLERYLPDEEAYNFGISGARILEIEAYLRHVIRWTPVDRVLIGLDFYQFDPVIRMREGFDPDSDKFSYLPEALARSLFSYDAFRDALKVYRLEKSRTRGGWRWNGLRVLRSSTSEVSESLAKGGGRVITRPPTDAEYESLERILVLAEKEDLELFLFLSPEHGLLRKAQSRAGQRKIYEVWKSKILKIAARHSVPICDFLLDHPLIEEPLGPSDTASFVDPTHYSPRIGGYILHRVGWARNPKGAASPEGFGTCYPRPREAVRSASRVK